MTMDLLKLYEDCRFVKGNRRSTVYDIGKETYHYIPNILYDLVSKFDKKTISDICEYYGNENKEIVLEYISFLIDNNFAFLCNDNQINNFSSLNLKWESPALITNAVIEFNPSIDYSDAINQLENLGCYYIQLRTSDIFPIASFHDLLNITTNTCLKSIEIISKYTPDHQLFRDVITINKRIKSIVLHSSPKDELILQRDSTHGNISAIKKRLKTPDDFNVIDPCFFNVNLPLFTESIDYNSYFNKKIFIDSKGEVKTNFNSKISFGNISNVSLKEIITKSDYQIYWDISKDKIQICQDCEHRYMCVDSRVPVKIEQNWIYEKECGYNPYIAKWSHELGYMTVEEGHSCI